MVVDFVNTRAINQYWAMRGAMNFLEKWKGKGGFNQPMMMAAITPLPIEGGYFRETWRSNLSVAPGTLPLRYTSERSLGTAIYYLLTSDPDSFSAMHRLPTDEIYHFYLGDPVEMLLLGANGTAERIRLGQSLTAGEHVQYVVPAGVWQGSRLIAGGSFALLGTTMSPGFDPSDYHPGLRAELIAQYPQHAASIQALTR